MSQEFQETRDYVYKVSDLNHELLWEIRIISKNIKYTLGILLFLTILILLTLWWKFIVATFIWLSGIILLLYKILEPTIDSTSGRDIVMYIFWALITYFAIGFIYIFLTKIIPKLWSTIYLQVRARRTLDKSNPATSQTDSPEVSNQLVDYEKMAYSERMNNYLKEAQSWLEKNKNTEGKH